MTRWLGVPVVLVCDTGDFDTHICRVCTKEPYAFKHTADSMGNFHTTTYESTADARDAAVLAKKDGAVVLVFTVPTQHRLWGTLTPQRASQLAVPMASKVAVTPAPAPRRAGMRRARSTRRAC